MKQNGQDIAHNSLKIKSNIWHLQLQLIVKFRQNAFLLNSIAENLFLRTLPKTTTTCGYV